MRPLALIAAVGRGGVIGDSTGHFGLPWHLPEDLKRFRALTTGHAVIMGRQTHELIGRPLPKRRNLVLSRRPGLALEGVEVVSSLDEALERVADDPLPFVIGGAQIYAEALPRVTRLFVTEVDRDAVGDAHFPAFDREAFEEVLREAGETPGVTFVEWVRRGVGEGVE
ncbi:MAG: dihydrofolate reductase [Sandaracinus sp.]|nr:dihydrofolate reductase [Sandaracinus sp.]MCB9624425.1 dihydrofolate reductase [Sandaracinus sp.]MCB9636255.1 dihydrofolate reductase [Sandaracinus sp.]